MSTRTIILQLQSPSGAPLGSPFASTITVSSLDPGVLQFSSATYSVTSGSSAALTVTRTGGSDGTVTVDYATSDGTARSFAGDPFYNSVVLLLYGNGADGTATITDEKSHTITASGVTNSATQVKYGAGSVHLSATTSTASTATLADLRLIGDFCFDFWIYLISASIGTNAIIGSSNPASDYSQIYLDSSRRIVFLTAAAGLTSTGAIPLTTWTHVACVRDKTHNIRRIFINGVQDTSQLTNGMADQSSNVSINLGANSGVVTNAAICYLDDVRLTIGAARYSVNFTPPAAQVPNYLIADYTSTSGTLTFTNGVTSQPISVPTAVNTGTVETFDPSKKSSGITLSAGNLTATATSASAKVSSITGYSSGKYYCEFLLNNIGGGSVAVGLGDSTTFNTNTTTVLGVKNTEYGYRVNGGGVKINNNVSVSYGGNSVAGDVVMLAVDFDNAKIYWGKNGTWFNSADPAAGTNAAYTSIVAGLKYATATLTTGSPASVTARFKSADFSYAAPSGFDQWSTEEPAETFAVTLSSPTGGATLGSPTTATVTIS